MAIVDSSSSNNLSSSSSPSHTPKSSTSPPPSTTATSKSSAKSRPAPTSNENGAPPRKRSRSDISPEERREARAHRNRIAAQNSRDKRKAQFSALEARIDELEAENRALRAGVAPPLSMAVDSVEHRAANAAREAENDALRERVRTLETAWEAIVRTLQTHSATAGLLPVLPQGSTSAPSPSSEPSASAPSPSPTGGERPLFGGAPAAGGSMQTDEDVSALLGAGAGETIDEAAMDDLFREILAAPPTPASASPSLTGGEIEVPDQDQDSAVVGADVDMDMGKVLEREIQRLFDLVPAASSALGLTLDSVPPLAIEESGNVALELDLGAWEASIGLTQPVL
ncbi:hypothetical protein BGW80DRAFT_1254311 [Lactifluus volemus]|nr:hypothetical protein BGW80DRAFT_1254311 [Lactifluus volemus]